VLAHHDYGNAGWTTDLSELAWESGVGSVSTVKRALTKLIELEEVEKVGGGHGLRAHYRLTLACPDACTKIEKHSLEMAQRGLSAAGDGPERAISKPRLGYVKGSERPPSSKKKKGGAGRQQPPSPSPDLDEESYAQVIELNPF
jgi:hypothetical protein